MKFTIINILPFLFVIQIFLGCKSTPNQKKPDPGIAFGKNDLSLNKLRGKVKEVETESHENSTLNTNVWLFDTAGYITESQKYGEVQSKNIYFRENKKLVCKKIFIDDELNDSIFYVRDKNGNDIKEITYFLKASVSSSHIDTSEILFCYDNDNNRIKEIAINTLQDTTYVTNSMYDKIGKLVKEIHSSRNNFTDSVIMEERKYYDKAENLSIDSTIFKGRLTSIDKYIYDEMGNNTEIQPVDPFGKMMQDRNPNGACTFSFTYDEHGNWIKCETIRKGKVVDTINRKITYY